MNTNEFLIGLCMMFLIVFIVLITAGDIAAYIHPKDNKCEIKVVCEIPITKVLEVIDANCGSTQLVKRDNNWYVFSKVCIDNDYCKYDYIPIIECI